MLAGPRILPPRADSRLRSEVATCRAEEVHDPRVAHITIPVNDLRPIEGQGPSHVYLVLNYL